MADDGSAHCTTIWQQQSCPPAAFTFRLLMLGASNEVDEACFQEVSGLSMEMENEPCHEGGQNLVSGCGSHDMPK